MINYLKAFPDTEEGREQKREVREKVFGKSPYSYQAMHYHISGGASKPHLGLVKAIYEVTGVSLLDEVCENCEIKKFLTLKH
jgi:hypothetical protein